MTLVLKRYVLPPFFAIILYTLLYFLFNVNAKFFNVGLLICILYSLLMRLTDDFCDYEKDKSVNKALLSKPTLFILLAIITATTIFLALFFHLYLTIIPLIIILLLLIYPKIGEYFKPLFIPSIMVSICFSLFTVNYILWILVAILTIADGFLIFKRR